MKQEEEAERDKVKGDGVETKVCGSKRGGEEEEGREISEYICMRLE